jgi:hypothetical protein
VPVTDDGAGGISTNESSAGNSFFISSMQQGGLPYYLPIITAPQAYNIDSKIDDGFPTTGTVRVVYLDVINVVPSFGYWGCNDYGGAPGTPMQYDVMGNLKPPYNSTDSPANPDRVECALNFGNAF